MNDIDWNRIKLYEVEEEINIDVSSADSGWNILGSYYLSEGAAKVELSNKSNEGVVIADAVKWVKRK